MYELIDEAWRIYTEGQKAIANSGDPAVTKKPEPPNASNVLQDPAHPEQADIDSKALLHVLQGERSWVEKLLHVSRSGRPSIVQALQHNLVAFAEAVDAAAENEALKSAGVPAERNRRAGGRGAAPGDLAATLRDRGSGTDDLPTDAELIARAEALAKREEERRKGTKRTPRKTG